MSSSASVAPSSSSSASSTSTTATPHHSHHSRYSPRTTLHNVEKLSQSLGYPDIFHPSKYRHPEWQFNAKWASRGYIAKEPVKDPYGSFDPPTCQPHTWTNFYNNIQLNQNTLKYQWKSYTTRKTHDSQRDKLRQARQILTCRESRMTGGIQSYATNHANAKQEWLQQLQRIDANTNLTKLAMHFPPAGFNDSTLFEDLYASRIPVSKSVWLIKLNLNIQYKSQLSSAALLSQHQKHCSQKWSKSLREYVLNPLFQKKPVDLEKTRYFIHLLTYCAEERLLDVDIFEDWLLTAPSLEILNTLLKELYQHNGMMEFTEKDPLVGRLLSNLASGNSGGGGTLTSSSSRQEARTMNSTFKNHTNFIIEQFKRAIKECKDSTGTHLHQQQKLLLSGLVELVENYSQNLPSFCEKLTSIPCGGKITHHLLKLVDQNSITGLDIPIETDQYSEMSIIKHLDNFLTHGNTQKLYSVIFSHERRYLQSIHLLCKWAYVGGNSGSGRYDPLRVNVCTFLLEELHKQLLESATSTTVQSKRFDNHSSHSFKSRSASELLADQHKMRTQNQFSRSSRSTGGGGRSSTPAAVAGGSTPRGGVGSTFHTGSNRSHHQRHERTTTPPYKEFLFNSISFTSSQAAQDYPLQEYFYHVLSECNSLIEKSRESWKSEATKTILHNIYKLFADLQERGLFCYELYTDWLVTENKLTFNHHLLNPVAATEHNARNFHYYFLKNTPIFIRHSNDSGGAYSSEDDDETSRGGGGAHLEDTLASNELRIRQMFLQRLGANFSEDDALVSELIATFPRLFDDDIEPEEEKRILSKIDAAPVYCKFALTRYIRNLIVRTFAGGVYSVAPSGPVLDGSTLTEVHFRTLFGLFHLVEDYRSLQFVLLALLYSIDEHGGNDTEGTANMSSSSIVAPNARSYVLCYFLNRYDLFISMGTAQVFLDLFWRVVTKHVYDQYLIKCLNSIECRFSFYAHREALTKYASPQNAKLIKDFSSTTLGGAAKSSAFFKFSDALKRDNSGGENLALSNGNTQMHSISKNSLASVFTQCMHLLANQGHGHGSSKRNDAAVSLLLEKIRTTLLSGAISQTDVTNAFISIMAQHFVSAQSRQMLQPLVQLLIHAVACTLLTADILVNNIVYPMTELIRVDVDNFEQGSLNVDMNHVVRSFHWFLMDALFSVEFYQTCGDMDGDGDGNRNKNGIDNTDNNTANETDNIPTTNTSTPTPTNPSDNSTITHILYHSQINCYSIKYLPKLVKSLLSICSEKNDAVRQIVFSLFTEMCGSCFFISRLLCSTEHVTRCLEHIDASSILTEEQKTEIFKSLFTKLIPNEYNKVKPLVDCSLLDYISFLKQRTDRWDAWINASILYIYLRRNSRAAQPPLSDEICTTLIDSIVESRDADLYSFLVTYQCEAHPECSKQLRKEMFSKFKSVLKDHNNENWEDQLRRIAFCCLENCRTDSFLADVVGQSLSNMLHDCMEMAKQAPLFELEDKDGSYGLGKESSTIGLHVLKQRAQITLDIIACVASYQPNNSKIVEMVKQLVLLFNSRLAQVESLHNLRDAHYSSIRNSVFKIIQLIENHPQLRSALKNAISVHSPQGSDVISKLDHSSMEQQVMLQFPKTAQDLKNRFFEHSWLAIEELTQKCDSCLQEHTRYFPSHSKFNSRIAERNGLFYSAAMGDGVEGRKRKREQSMDGDDEGPDLKRIKREE